MKRILENQSVKKAKKHVAEKSFIKETALLYIFLAGVFLVLVNFVYLMTSLKSGQGSQPLRYNYFFGIVETGSWNQAYILPVFLTVIIIANVALAQYFYNRDKFMTYVFLIVNLFLASIALIESIALNMRGL